MLPVLLLLASIALTPAPTQDHEPLLDVPAGWRHERMELPLSFAPELSYAGFEDLSFAPGMFVPDSDSYFSYALALRLEGDVRVDVEMLEGFLDSYYRGLCSAVAEGKELEHEPSEVHAHVERRGGSFHAKVEMFDPFTNGAPLELVLELYSHAAPRATEVLGLASPLAGDAPIWSELHALGERWRARRAAPVFLNHLYFVVDPETYGALAGSDFLRKEFGASEERTTARADMTYSGLYFYGERTYFEFLRESPQAGFLPGFTGLALGVDEEGGLAAFAGRLAAAQIPAQGGPITRQLGDDSVPWFEILGLEMPSAPLSLFAMEYDSRFLGRWHPSLAPKNGGIERGAVLERYAASLDLSELRSSALLEDVLVVELALDGPQRERVTAACVAAGFEVESGDGRWTCLGPGVRFEIRGAEQPGGVVAVELGLRRPVEREPLRLGRALLSFDDRVVTLSLQP